MTPVPLLPSLPRLRPTLPTASTPIHTDVSGLVVLGDVVCLYVGIPAPEAPDGTKWYVFCCVFFKSQLGFIGVLGFVGVGAQGAQPTGTSSNLCLHAGVN